MGTGLGDTENTARGENLPATTASRALPNVRACLRALAPADITLLRLGNSHFFLAPVSALLEADFHVVTEVIAALRLTGILSDPATKQVVKNAPAAEYLAE